MARVNIHLDDDVLAAVKLAAQAAGISPDKWIAEAIRRRSRAEWPAYVMSLAGAWPDFPTADEIRENRGVDLPRKRI